MASITNAAPQLLVDDLARALAFYGQRLGFRRDFVHDDFYASVSRDGAVIHLKCAPKLEAERAHRRAEEHLDAYLTVSGIGELHTAHDARRLARPREVSSAHAIVRARRVSASRPSEDTRASEAS